MQPRYVIDTCSLTGLQRVYPPDMFPQVWAFVTQLALDGVLVSCEEVYKELNDNVANDDVIAKWSRDNKAIFRPIDPDVQLEVRSILAKHQKLVDYKKRKSQADPFVIATGKLLGATVVTEEKPSGGPGKEKIPDVCKASSVPCITLLEMLRIERFQA